MNVRLGPTGKGALPAFAHIECDYVDKKTSGASPKFTCALSERDEVKIKYGADNYEVYGEVAGSRLLWTLGFGADRWYPVSVTCHRCPDDPHRNPRPTERDVLFDVAALERPLEGRKIETRPDQGWQWPELNLVKEAGGGAPWNNATRLKLLAVSCSTPTASPSSSGDLPRRRPVEPCPSPFMHSTTSA